MIPDANDVFSQKQNVEKKVSPFREICARARALGPLLFFLVAATVFEKCSLTMWMGFLVHFDPEIEEMAISAEERLSIWPRQKYTIPTQLHRNFVLFLNAVLLGSNNL